MAVKPIPGSTTAIGSLPHTDATAASEFALSACDVPAWPQLPKRDVREGMILQFAADLPGLVVDEAKKSFRVERANEYLDQLTAFCERVLDPKTEFPLAQSHAAGFYAFVGRLLELRQRAETGKGVAEKQLEKAREAQRGTSKSLGDVLVQIGEMKPEELRATKAWFVKGQVTGPLTFLLGMNMDDGRPIRADDELRQAGMTILSRNAAWQANMLKPLGKRGAVIFMDEPIYSALGTAAYLSVGADDVRSTVSEVAKAVRAEGALVGIHCCGSADWETVLGTDIDILNFDAWSYFETFELYPEAISAFLDRGGCIAWGIVPTSDDINQVGEDDVTGRLDREVASLVEKGIDAGRLKRQSMLTPSCGCATRTPEETQKVFEILRAVGEHWRKKM